MQTLTLLEKVPKTKSVNKKKRRRKKKRKFMTKNCSFSLGGRLEILKIIYCSLLIRILRFSLTLTNCIDTVILAWQQSTITQCLSLVLPSIRSVEKRGQNTSPIHIITMDTATSEIRSFTLYYTPEAMVEVARSITQH